jgi:lipopolysaccharide export LptBFGC system permease protein LptF
LPGWRCSSSTASAFLGPDFFLRAIPVLALQVLPYTIAFGTLAGITMIVGRLAADREDIILQFNGVPVSVVLAPVWVVGVAASVCAFVAVHYLEPESAYGTDKQRTDVLEALLAGLPNEPFAFSARGMPVAIAYAGRDGDTLRQLTLLPTEAAERSGWTPFADATDGPGDRGPEGWHDVGAGPDGTPTTDAARLREIYSQAIDGLDVAPPLDWVIVAADGRIDFQRRTGRLRIILRDCTAAVWRDWPFDEQPLMLAANRLVLPLTPVDAPGDGAAALTDSQRDLLAAAPRLVPEIDGFSPPRRRVRTMTLPLLQAHIAELHRPVGLDALADDAIDSPDALAEAEADRRKALAKAQTALWKRWAVVAAPMVFLLIGVPLGIRLRQGNLLVTFVAAVLVVLASWFAALSGVERSAENGVVPPWVTFAAPTGAGLLVAVAIFLSILRRPILPFGRLRARARRARNARRLRGRLPVAASTSTDGPGALRVPDTVTIDTVTMSSDGEPDPDDPPSRDAEPAASRSTDTLRVPARRATPSVARRPVPPQPILRRLFGAAVRVTIGGRIDRYVLRQALLSIGAALVVNVALFVTGDYLSNVETFRNLAESRTEAAMAEYEAAGRPICRRPRRSRPNGSRCKPTPFASRRSPTC